MELKNLFGFDLVKKTPKAAKAKAGRHNEARALLVQELDIQIELLKNPEYVVKSVTSGKDGKRRTMVRQPKSG